MCCNWQALCTFCQLLKALSSALRYITLRGVDPPNESKETSVEIALSKSMKEVFSNDIDFAFALCERF